jgi:hypothetical protein
MKRRLTIIFTAVAMLAIAAEPALAGTKNMIG